MRISDLFEATQNTVVIYPGRFHPFHKGHAQVYRWLASKFDNVFIATSNKVDPPKSPFTFEEKKQMMTHAGVPANAIVQVKNPYIATEITNRYDPENTAAIFAVSEKDMAEDPRFQFKPKKDGSPSYYQPYGGDMEPLSRHGYIITTPTFDFTVLGEPMRSATELRRNFANADQQTQAEMIKDLYGKYDPAIHRIMAAKITQ
jgi:cytidyltransferase-like protein